MGPIPLADHALQTLLTQAVRKAFPQTLIRFQSENGRHQKKQQAFPVPNMSRFSVRDHF